MAKEENLNEKIAFKIKINEKNIQNKYDYIRQLIDIAHRDLDKILDDINNKTRNDILAFKVRDAGMDMLDKYEEIRHIEDENRFLNELIR